VVASYSYYNADPANIRNIAEYGGGGVMDIGCYPIFISRWIFGEEPVRVQSAVERDPVMKTDRLTSAILEFPSGTAVFTCSTQLVPYQMVQLLGTKGRIQVEIPFNAPPDKPCRVWIDDGSYLFGGKIETYESPVCDQYAAQGDAFSRAIQENGEVPVSLEYALKNMEVIEAVLKQPCVAGC
jgi:predicted dehydrogenase